MGLFWVNQDISTGNISVIQRIVDFNNLIGFFALAEAQNSKNQEILATKRRWLGQFFYSVLIFITQADKIVYFLATCIWFFVCLFLFCFKKFQHLHRWTILPIFSYPDTDGCFSLIYTLILPYCNFMSIATSLKLKTLFFIIFLAVSEFTGLLFQSFPRINKLFSRPSTTLSPLDPLQLINFSLHRMVRVLKEVEGLLQLTCIKSYWSSKI